MPNATQTTLIYLLVAGLLVACSPRSSSACYGLSDSDALRNVIRNYYSEPLSARSGPASRQMKLSKERLIGVGRSAYPKGNDNVIDLWFLQDDGTVTTASYFENCDLEFSTGNSRGDMERAAIPVTRPSIVETK